MLSLNLIQTLSNKILHFKKRILFVESSPYSDQRRSFIWDMPCIWSGCFLSKKQKKSSKASWIKSYHYQSFEIIPINRSTDQLINRSILRCYVNVYSYPLKAALLWFSKIPLRIWVRYFALKWVIAKSLPKNNLKAGFNLQLFSCHCTNEGSEKWQTVPGRRKAKFGGCLLYQLTIMEKMSSRRSIWPRYFAF